VIRTHVAKTETPIHLVAKPQEAGSTYKPVGFWYEVDGDWRRWATSEMPHWIEGHWLHVVELAEERLLTIQSAAQLDDFDREFRHREFVSGYSERYGPMHKGIRWSAVAERWGGIEIAPYLWERRLGGPSSYYGWDCASGVIWRPRGATVTPAGPVALWADKLEEQSA
jgi:hypothetical protein